MNNTKKVATVLLALVMTMVLATGVWAQGYIVPVPISDAWYEQLEQLYPWPNFGSETGTVTSVELLPQWGDQGADTPDRFRIRIEIEESRVADFNVIESTFILGDMPQVGDVITGFFNNNMPMILIYPPQYTAVAIVGSDVMAAYVDRFFLQQSGEFLSADGMRRLGIPEGTPVVSQGGQDATDWELDGRQLLVIYTIASRSLPPLIFAPEKVVVFYETAVHPIGTIDWDYLEWEPNPDWYVDSDLIGIIPPIGEIDWDYPTWDPGVSLIWGNDYYFNYDIIVEGQGLYGESPLVVGDFYWATHVPLRPVLEALGLELHWADGIGTFHGLLGQVSFQTLDGTNTFTVAGETITLPGQALVLHQNRTYVPLAFFRDVVGMNNAYFSSGVVVIDNSERME